MARIDLQVSDEEKIIAKRIASVNEMSTSDFIRMILDNYDPEKEVKEFDLDRDSDPDNKDLYWYDYADRDLRKMKLTLPHEYTAKHMYVVVHKPMGQSLIDALKIRNQQKDKFYQAKGEYETDLQYIAFLLKNLTSNYNQIAKACNYLKRRGASQKELADLVEAMGILKDNIASHTKAYTKELDKYMQKLISEENPKPRLSKKEVEETKKVNEALKRSRKKRKEHEGDN